MSRGQIDHFMEVISGIESGGRDDPYSATHPTSGAHGRWQIMPSNWSPWAQAAGLSANAPQTPENQRTVARHRMLHYYDQYGSWPAVAVAWFAGPSRAQTWLNNPSAVEGITDANNYSVGQYVQRVQEGMGQPAETGTTMTTTSTDGQAASDMSPEDRAYDLYPNLSVWLDHEEIGPILLEAAEQGLSRERLQAKVWETDWWNETTEKIREWDQLRNTDPSEADRRVEMMSTEFWRLAVTEFGFTDLDPEDFGSLAEQALRNGWTEAEQRKAIKSHSDFVHLSDPEKQWESEQLLNPAELANRIEQNRATVTATAEALGLPVDTSQVYDIAVDFTRYGWNEAQLRERLVNAADWSDTDRLTGEAAKITHQLGEVSGDYLIRVSDNARKSWAKSILGGTESMDGFREYAKQHAKSRFPTMESAIDRGLSVQDWVEPYRQMAAQTLEINPDEVDFFDDEFSVLLDGSTDDKGERVPMSLAEAQRHMRQSDRWKGTEQARRRAEELSAGLTQAFGKVAT